MRRSCSLLASALLVASCTDRPGPVAPSFEGAVRADTGTRAEVTALAIAATLEPRSVDRVLVDAREALQQATTLVQAMIGGRAALNVSPLVGAEAQAKAMEAIASLSAARLAVVACHTEMAKDHRRMGWGVYAQGPLDKGQGDGGLATTGEHRLRAV